MILIDCICKNVILKQQVDMKPVKGGQIGSLIIG